LPKIRFLTLAITYSYGALTWPAVSSFGQFLSSPLRGGRPQDSLFPPLSFGIPADNFDDFLLIVILVGEILRSPAKG